MNMILRYLTESGGLLVWLAMWITGGWLLVRSLFALKRSEIGLIGLGTGLVVQTLFADFMGLVMPIPAAFWAAAGLTFLLGCAAFWAAVRKCGKEWIFPTPKIDWKISWLWAGFGLLTLIFFLISRGLGIFDDYQNLPMTSLIAAGGFPPRFALDPGVPFDYHYFLLLFAAQWMRIGHIYPWNALDLSRSILFALALMLSGMWAVRITRNRAAGFLTGLFMALAGGSRWLLLLLPEGLIEKVSAQIQMIGSGATSGKDLLDALTSDWSIQGAGRFPFPFAFANGVQNPLVMSHGGTGAMAVVIGLLLLLTFTRWQGMGGSLVTVVYLGGMALTDEIWFVFISAAFFAVVVLQAIRQRGFRFTRGFWTWIFVFSSAWIVALIEGGVLSGIARGLLGRLSGASAAASYYTVQFPLVWPPALVSAHLGMLSFGNIYQLLTAACEIGPIILVIPWLAVWGWKCWRAERWFETALALAGGVSLLSVFVQYSGSAGISASARLPGYALNLCRLYAVPLIWLWLQKRQKVWPTAAAGVGLVVMLGGAVFFGIELLSARQPVYSYFIGDLDVKMEKDYWNRLDPRAMVFDPESFRSATLFARPANSSITWYESKPEWDSLVTHPDPYTLLSAGYEYAYFDRAYWEALPITEQNKLQNACVLVMKEYVDWTHDFRRLLDLRQCLQ